MHWLGSDYSRDLYHHELQYLFDHGEYTEVRGRKTMETLDFITEVRQPWHHCILLPSRHWNPWLAMSEALWILAGRNDVATLKPYNQHISDYSDDGVTLYGAYGRRIYNQIDPLIERLRKDPSDRRAVLQIWTTIGSNENGWWDLGSETKDPPCNDMVFFKLRNNKLHMTVINRSNDIHFGLFAVNLPTFGILQAYMAARLGVEMGYQTHLSNSLHVYIDDERAKAITERMLFDEPEDRPAYPSHSLVFNPRDVEKITSHAQFAEMCSDVLDTAQNGGKLPKASYPLFLAFATAFLHSYKERIAPNFQQFPEFQDWELAGKIFAQKVWHK